MSKRKLMQQLKKLRVESVGVEQEFKSARERLWHFLADAYAFYVDAESAEDFLHDVYEAEGIRVQQRNTPHQKYLPFLKLLNPDYRDEGAAAKINPYAQALAAIEEKERQSPFIFATNRAQAAFVFLKELRGVTPAKQWLNLELGETGGDEVTEEWVKATSPKSTRKEDGARALKRIHTAKLRQIHALKPLATLDLGDFPSYDNTVLLVAKRRNDGKLDIVATAHEEQLVQKAVDEAITVPHVQHTPVFSTICNMLRIHAVPRSIQRNGIRDKFFRESDIAPIDGEKRREAVRIAALSDGTFVCSKVRARKNSSLLTIATPKDKRPMSGNFFLRGVDRHFLETRLLLDGDVMNWKVVGKELAKASDEVVADKQIALQNLETTHRRNRYFYDMQPHEEEQIETQPIAARKEALSVHWQLSLTPGFVNRVYREHLLRWIDGINKRINTKKNQSFELVVSSKGICIRSEWDNKNRCYTRHLPEDVLVRFGAQDKVKLNDLHDSDGKQLKKAKFNASLGKYDFVKLPSVTKSDEVSEVEPYSIRVSPSDIFMLFEALSTASGRVTVKGNERIMWVEHKDEFASYKTYIPSTDVKGVRVGNLFVSAREALY